ncbi:hypothetical protein FKM82_016145 [Ascaphus truei]
METLFGLSNPDPVLSHNDSRATVRGRSKYLPSYLHPLPIYMPGEHRQEFGSAGVNVEPIFLLCVIFNIFLKRGRAGDRGQEFVQKRREIQIYMVTAAIKVTALKRAEHECVSGVSLQGIDTLQRSNGGIREPFRGCS